MSLKYRISSVGWYNFEFLVQTLLKLVIGPGVSSFGGSKDRGRDAVFVGTAFPNATTQWGGYWSFQVKYVDFEEQGVDAARTALKIAFRKELVNIVGRHQEKSQSIDNYILITDVPLTGDVRDALAAINSESGLTANFAVIDGKEICQFLDTYPDVGRSHPQLLGLADLDVIINRDLYVRSQAYVEQWQPRLGAYVVTDAHSAALTLIKKTHFLVLDGPPEAGKTTIAAALALSYAADGFEVFDIRESNDIFSLYAPDKSQIFIADDAVGSISLDPARADDWSRDLPAIVRKLDKNHFLIWTARRYILEEALAESRLGEAVAQFPTAQEVIVEVGGLSTTMKAEILYNHAKRSNLRTEYRDLIRKGASQIIHHGNFTPERVRQLVEVVLKPQGDDSEPLLLSWEDVLTFLANPSDRWSQAYRKLSASEQALLAAMLDFDGPVALEDLKVAYESRSAVITARLTFEECVGRLQHSFLRATKSFQEEEFIEVQHPSLRDMLLVELRDDAAARSRYITLASPFGIASMIGGIASTDEEMLEAEHALVPKNDREVELLLARIRTLSRTVLRLRDWEELMGAVELLVPRRTQQASDSPLNEDDRQDSAVRERIRKFKGESIRAKRMEPSEIDIVAFSRTQEGRIIGAVVEGFSNRETFEGGQRFSSQDWLRMLVRFYELTSYVPGPVVPSFTDDLCARIGAGSTDSVRLANVIQAHEPLIFKQKISQAKISGWKLLLEDDASRLADQGNAFDDDSDANVMSSTSGLPKWLHSKRRLRNSSRGVKLQVSRVQLNCLMSGTKRNSQSISITGRTMTITVVTLPTTTGRWDESSKICEVRPVRRHGGLCAFGALHLDDPLEHARMGLGNNTGSSNGRNRAIPFQTIL